MKLMVNIGQVISRSMSHTISTILSCCYFNLKLNGIRCNPPELFLGKCSENMQQVYRRPPMLKCDFNKVALQLDVHGCSPVNSLDIFRTTCPKNTSTRQLL